MKLVVNTTAKKFNKLKKGELSFRFSVSAQSVCELIACCPGRGKDGVGALSVQSFTARRGTPGTFCRASWKMSGQTKRFIYFCGSIRGGREDAALYKRIIDQLKQYGDVLTEHIADADILDKDQGLRQSI